VNWSVTTGIKINSYGEVDKVSKMVQNEKWGCRGEGRRLYAKIHLP
jgi:hypothetical protein